MRSLSDLQLSIERLHEIIDDGVRLFISSDHEGGQLETVPGGILPSPGNKALGASNEPHYAYIFGDFLGNELRKIGFNMLFAPVLDVRANKSSPVVGLRSFSDNPKIVAEYGVNFF